MLSGKSMISSQGRLQYTLILKPMPEIVIASRRRSMARKFSSVIPCRMRGRF